MATLGLRFASVSTHRRLYSSIVQQKEFEKRRENLQNMLPDNGFLLVPGYGLRYSTNSIFYPFHQSTDLLYLTGFNEPNAFMVLGKKECTMFVQPADPQTEIWDGKRVGLEGAKKDYGATEAFPIYKIEGYLKQLLNKDATLITDLPLDVEPQHDMLQGTHINLNPGSATHPTNRIYGSSLKRQKATIRPLGTFIQQLRLYKSEGEKALMRKSGQIAGRGFQAAMKRTHPGMTEHQLATILEYEMKMSGATGLSYVPVVASGKSALILHNVTHKGVLNDGELVLVDCGAEYSHYASDVTRTWPVNGKFTRPQAEIYSLVLQVQKAIIKEAQAGKTSLDQLQQKTTDLFQEGLSKLFNRPVSRAETSKLFPHHVSHYIGLDVHDTTSIPRSIYIEEGMTFTVEPGLYIPDGPQYGEYRGIGVRIEDVVYMQEEGAVVLTAEAPKEIEDIEHLMSRD